MTIQESFSLGSNEEDHDIDIEIDEHEEENNAKSALQGRTIAWVGDGNNIIHSLMACGPKLGINLQISTPRGHECDPGVLQRCQDESNHFGTDLIVTTDPTEAVCGSDVIVTDTWISMGQEDEKAARLKAFDGYQVCFLLRKWKFYK